VSERFSRVPIWVTRLRLPLLTLLVLIALCCYANREGKCFPSMKSIADRVGIPRKKVPAHIKTLVEQGVISVTPSRSRRSNRYLIHYKDPMDESAECSAPGDSESPEEGRAEALNVPSSGARTAQETNQPNERTSIAGKSAGWTGGQNQKALLQEAFISWNRVAKECGLQVVDSPSLRLCIDLQKCLAGFGGLASWDAALDEVRRTPFLRGHGKNGWQVTLGWLIKPGNLTKVVSGQYRPNEGSRRGLLAEFANRLVANMSASRADE
jgi:hypothetical protein